MAMLSRVVCQSRRPSNALIRHHRHRSSKPQLIEVDLDADSSEAGMRNLEEALQSIIVRRAAPDWLPFLPGHSYWVPPRNTPATAPIFQLNSTNTNHRLPHQFLSEDEQMSLVSSKGWPCSTYFIQGTSPQQPLPLMILSDTSSSKDES